MCDGGVSGDSWPTAARDGTCMIHEGGLRIKVRTQSTCHLLHWTSKFPHWCSLLRETPWKVAFTLCKLVGTWESYRRWRSITNEMAEVRKDAMTLYIQFVRSYYYSTLRLLGALLCLFTTAYLLQYSTVLFASVAPQESANSSDSTEWMAQISKMALPFAA